MSFPQLEEWKNDPDIIYNAETEKFNLSRKLHYEKHFFDYIYYCFSARGSILNRNMQYSPHNLYPTKINICPPPEEFDSVTIATNVLVNKQKLEIQRQKSKGIFDPVQVVEMYNEDEKREVFVECSWPGFIVPNK